MPCCIKQPPPPQPQLSVYMRLIKYASFSSLRCSSRGMLSHVHSGHVQHISRLLVFQWVLIVPHLWQICSYIHTKLILYNIYKRVIGSRSKETSFNLTFRYIDDVLSFNNSKFNDNIDVIYPKELKIKDTADALKWTLWGIYTPLNSPITKIKLVNSPITNNSKLSHRPLSHVTMIFCITILKMLLSPITRN